MEKEESLAEGQSATAMDYGGDVPPIQFEGAASTPLDGPIVVDLPTKLERLTNSFLEGLGEGASLAGMIMPMLAVLMVAYATFRWVNRRFSVPVDKSKQQEKGLRDMTSSRADQRLAELGAAFAALGDDPDYLADVVARSAGTGEAEKLRDLFQAVGAVLDQARQQG